MRFRVTATFSTINKAMLFIMALADTVDEFEMIDEEDDDDDEE